MSSKHNRIVNNSDNSKDEPPSYDEVINALLLQNLASAPLLENLPSAPQFEAFSWGIFGTTSVQFEYNSEDASGYSFYIRDTAGEVQAKGYVYDFDTSLQNINGILRINQKESEKLNVRRWSISIEGYLQGYTARRFDIYNKGRAIGTVKVAENAPAEACIQIINNLNPRTIVKSFKVGEFNIFRDDSSEIPLCNIHIPVGEAFTEKDFSGNITFHPETEITTEEQLICTAAAIAFKVAMKNKVNKREEVGNCLFFGRCLSVVIIIVVVYVAFFRY